MQEILTTEQTYVRSLHALTQAFKDPIAKRIEEGSFGLTEAQFHTIFSNVEEIIQVRTTRFINSLIIVGEPKVLDVLKGKIEGMVRRHTNRRCIYASR